MKPNEKILAKVLQKHPDALAEYIEDCRPYLLNFLRKISSAKLRGVVEIEDIFQEVSSTALASLATAPFEEYEPLEWLKQVARRRVIDVHRYHFGAQRRDAGRLQAIDGGGIDDSAKGLAALLAASATTPSAAFSRDHRLSRLEQEINALPDDQQQAIRLRYSEGLSSQEVAAMLGKTDGAVRVMLSRVLRRLKDALEDVKPKSR